MKRGTGLLIGFLLPALLAVAVALLPSVARATLTETPVACKEGVIREPIPLKYGEHTDGCQLDYITDVDQFSFYGKTGEEVTIAVGWTTFPYTNKLLITVLNPSGSVILKETTKDGYNFYDQYYRKSVPLTETGTHYILIEENEHDATAGYQLDIEVIPPIVSCPRLTTSSPVTGVIEGPADIDLFAFQGSAGSVLHIPVSFVPETGPAYVHTQILDPDGDTVVDQTSDTNLVLDLSITKNGRYYLIIDGVGVANQYEVLLQCIFGNCKNLQPQPPVEGCLREKGQPLAGVKVKLEQAGEPNRFKVTDSRGCYSFSSVVADLEYRVSVAGTVE
jgi:hypothetical protein